MRIMAIDYGDVRTGVAVSDEKGFLAGQTFLVRSRRMDRAVADIIALAREHQVDEIVLGYPKNMNNTIGPRAELCEEVAEELRAVAGDTPVILWDERLTTVDAHRVLEDNGIRFINRKNKVDAVAATLILEGYLGWKRSQARRQEEDHG